MTYLQYGNKYLASRRKWVTASILSNKRSEELRTVVAVKWSGNKKKTSGKWEHPVTRALDVGDHT